MKRASILTVVTAVLAAAPGARAGGVVIDMPAPPPAAAEEVSDAPTVGDVALVRYGHRRTSPRSNGTDLGVGAWNWRSGWGWGGAGWGGGWGGGGYYPAYPYYGYGGYRISFGPQFFARRAWNGGYVRPAWAWTVR